MSSRAIIVLFQASSIFMLAISLAGFAPMSAGAESATQPPAALHAADTVRSLSQAPVKPTVSKLPLTTTDQRAPATSTHIDGAKSGAIMSAPGSIPVSSGTPRIQSQLDGTESLNPAQRRTYLRAASAFTSFCHDWERLLHEREINNLDHLTWREDGGLEIATYTGYGKIESCECKASKEGLPIGKIRYREENYSIAGKTIEEARHAARKLTNEISTLEIFSWDKGKWFY